MLAGKIGYFRPTGFDPRSISGLALFLDASNAGSLTIGTGVSQWRDISGNGRSMNQSTAASQPTYSATGLNGRPSIQFTAASARWMSGTWSVTLTGQTTFAVASMASASNGNARLFSQVVQGQSGDFSGTNHYVPLQRAGSGQQIASLAGGADGRAAVGFPAYTTPFVASSIHSGSQISNRVNNGAAATFSSTLNTTFNTMLLSNYTASAAGGYLTGFISEVLVYSRALTDTERSTVYAYLGSKWGVTVA
jgi:hypothetical protein